MPKKPLVSVIVPTLNGAPDLEICLQSVKDQTYEPIEIIVVINPRTTDSSKVIAEKFTSHIFIQGPERSAQVNYGVAKATGEYVYKIDDDFQLAPEVVAECVDKAEHGADAVVAHNSPDTRVSWISRVRKFEVDMYKYDLTHSSARFVRKDVYEAIGGFNSTITAGEDYDFQNKLNRGGYKTAFIDAETIHLGEPAKLWPHLYKYYLYGKDFNNYLVYNRDAATKQLAFGRSVYLKHWRSFLRHPVTALEFAGYNLLKYAFGGVGLVVGKLQGIRNQKPGEHK
ncbi:MAG TPA: glycosyltransferase [Candidatus Saccharimonadia bacterium]|nr:glycosyltransferase [Candidatus Saccharimonadia bacterium]